MLKGTDKISDFPEEFNKLEKKVIEDLSRNTRGIKIAMWVTAISTLAIAIVGIITFIIQCSMKF